MLLFVSINLGGWLLFLASSDLCSLNAILLLKVVLEQVVLKMFQLTPIAALLSIIGASDLNCVELWAKIAHIVSAIRCLHERTMHLLSSASILMVVKHFIRVPIRVVPLQVRLQGRLKLERVWVRCASMFLKCYLRVDLRKRCIPLSGRCIWRSLIKSWDRDS